MSASDLSIAANPLADEPSCAAVDAAILWSIRLDYNNATIEDRNAFEQWLAEDRQHVEAWRRVAVLHRDFARLPPKTAKDTLRSAETRRRERGLDRRQAIKMLSLASVGLTSGWITWRHTPWQRLLADASTGTGEQQTLQLSDGSVLLLNTDTAVSADMRGNSRRIILRRGEILITTGADTEAAAKRPFWVYTPFGKMQALGTRFVVRLEREGARVGVQEGAVALHPAIGDTATIYPGESRWLMRTATVAADLQGIASDAWTEGVVAGQNLRLQDLLTELARYRHGRISCDPRIADLRLSGAFQLRDTDQTLNFIAQTQPVSITYHTRFWVSVQPRHLSLKT
jgi:transmembrane sensor